MATSQGVSDSKKRTTVLFTNEIVDWIEDMSANTGISSAQVVNVAMELYIRQFKGSQSTYKDFWSLAGKLSTMKIAENIDNTYVFTPTRSFNLDEIVDKDVNMKITKDGYIILKTNPDAE